MNATSDGWLVTLAPLAEGSEAWNRLLAQVSGTVLYHKRRWLEVLRKAYNMRLMTVLAVDQGGGVGAGSIFAMVGFPLRRRMVSLPFSDSCPPLALDDSALRQMLAAVSMNQLGQRTFEIRGIAAPEPWQIVDCFGDWWLPLDQPRARLESATAKHFGRQVRNGSKEGILIERGSDQRLLRRFYGLMVQGRRRQGIPPPPFRLFEAVSSVFGDDCIIWLATKGGCDVAGLVLLRDGDRLYYRWGARADRTPPGANHLLFWRLIEDSAQKFESLELGRTDLRNRGLCRFKQELGAACRPLPYSFFPHSDMRVSPEVLSGAPLLASRMWRYLPLPVTRLFGAAIYRYCA